jgi:CO/xanthine dehydrogenase Mo-binding subunit/aerobic-type carbon monoxide dehydrogenase small subunit (CoxS/CutS family)
MISPSEKSVQLRLNGHVKVVLSDAATRLSSVLRDELGLSGTKVGCAAGDCGACLVLIDGRQACACATALGQVADREITTIEGLAADPLGRHLQAAFAETGAAQCGACTPGMLIASLALLRETSHPTEAQVQGALSGVLCRCTGYRLIVAAILRAANGRVAAQAAPAGAAVGARLAKLDAAPILDGSARYGADLAPPGALWLRVLRSPYPRACFQLGDLAALRQRAGVVDVLTAADVPVNAFGIFDTTRDQPVLADGAARYSGEAVLALVGERRTIETIDLDQVPIEWQLEPPIDSIEAALSGAGPVHASVPDNVLIRGRVVRGEVERGFAAAAQVTSGDFSTSYVEHAYIELEAGYAQRDGDRVTVFSCTQTPYMDRDEIARILNIGAQQVRVLPSAIGGGFGGKLDLSIQPLLALAAWRTGRPVRGEYSRAESMRATTKRHPARMCGRMGVAADGRITAVDFHGDFNTGAYASWGNTVANRVPIHASGPYFVPNVRALTRAIYTNGPISGAFRGFGVPQSTIVTETLLDESAESLGLDPWEIRYRNALRAGQRTSTGQVLESSCGLERCLDVLKPHWQAARAACAEWNAGNHQRKRGAGIACMWYGIGNTVIANPSRMRVALTGDGSIVLYNGAVDIGQGSNTVLAQICADALGLPVRAIKQVLGDTDRTFDAGKSSASRQTFVSGNAALRAGTALRRRLLELLDAPDHARLTIAGGELAAADGDRRWRRALCELSSREGEIASGEGYFDPPTVPLDADGQGVPYATYAFGAQIAIVEVEQGLGTVRVVEMFAAHDVGRAINPTQVEGQIHGGIAQGIGMALMEEYVAGRSDNLHDYLIPSIGDVPPIHVSIIEDAEPLGPFGAKGVGEPALIATAPAILNAIFHATGCRIRTLPVTPTRMLEALQARRQ